MSDSITITLPAIDETIINTIETEIVATLDTETHALQALREKYATLARQNGYIRIGYTAGGDSNYRFEHASHLRENGRKVKALLCDDGFDNPKTEQFGGKYSGTRLYLAADGRWIEILRAGHWSQWQNSTDIWACGDVVWDDDDSNDEDDHDSRPRGGSVVFLTDAEVAEAYKLDAIIKGLGESLKTLAEKLPQRLAKVQQRARLASHLLAALKSDGVR